MRRSSCSCHPITHMYHWAMGNALCGFQPFDEGALKILYRSLHQLNPEKMVHIVSQMSRCLPRKNRIFRGYQSASTPRKMSKQLTSHWTRKGNVRPTPDQLIEDIGQRSLRNRVSGKRNKFQKRSRDVLAFSSQRSHYIQIDGNIDL